MIPNISAITREIARTICRRQHGDPDAVSFCGRPIWAGFVKEALEIQSVIVGAGLVSVEALEKWRPIVSKETSHD
ncbi:MAG: hypothetical protein ABT940_03070 [Alphaproteobacteria bacterium]